MKFRLLAIGVLCAASTAALSQVSAVNDPTKSLGIPGAEQDFYKASLSNLNAAIIFSKMAAEKATNADVKSLAGKIAEDSTRIGVDVAHGPGGTEKGPVGLPGKFKKENEKLTGLSGAEYDKEYINAILKIMHDQMSEFREETANTHEFGFRPVVDNDLHTIHMNADAAKTLQQQVGK